MGKREEQAYRDAKKAAVQALNQSGRSSVHVSDNIGTIQRACEIVFGARTESETTPEYFLRVARIARETALQVTVASPRTPRKFEQLTTVAHPRQAEIDALPNQITMHGIGNGREDHTQFVRGAGRGS